MNSSFNYYKGFGYGALIWMIMFAFISFEVGFGVATTIWGQLLAIAVSAVAAYVLAFSAKSADIAQALTYGFLWAVVGIALDLLISYQFNNTIFGAWQYWLSYVLVFLAPALQITFQPTSRHSTTMHATH